MTSLRSVAIIIAFTSAILLLSSCQTIKMTPQEIEEGKKICELAGKDFNIYSDASRYICERKIDKVQECINSFVNTIDEKYNNPDTVQYLREDDYSTVVKTCKETFGVTPITK